MAPSGGGICELKLMNSVLTDVFIILFIILICLCVIRGLQEHQGPREPRAPPANRESWVLR